MSVINLLPPELKNKKKQIQLNMTAISLGGSWIVLLFILTAVLFFSRMTLHVSLQANQSEINWLQNAIDQKKDIVSQAYLINDRLQVIKAAQVQNKFSVFLDETIKATPSALQITDFTINPQSKPPVKIQGYAASRREVVKLMEKFDASPYFKEMTFESSNLSEDKVNFTINGQIEKIP